MLAYISQQSINIVSNSANSGLSKVHHSVSRIWALANASTVMMSRCQILAEPTPGQCASYETSHRNRAPGINRRDLAYDRGVSDMIAISPASVLPPCLSAELYNAGQFEESELRFVVSEQFSALSPRVHRCPTSTHRQLSARVRPFLCL